MRTFGQPLSKVTPAIALQLLKHGNFRFINNIALDRDHIDAVSETKDGQSPFAAILSCMDSRTSAELIFDQSFGDVFSIRIAGNVISSDVLGSLEYAAAVVGSRLIVVLGHTNCGAVKGACDQVHLGNLTSLLSKIDPLLSPAVHVEGPHNGGNPHFVNAIAEAHVKQAAREILAGSSIISDLVHSGKVGIIPAMYDLATGKVHFYDHEAILANIVEPAELQEAFAIR